MCVGDSEEIDDRIQYKPCRKTALGVTTRGRGSMVVIGSKVIHARQGARSRVIEALIIRKVWSGRLFGGGSSEETSRMSKFSSGWDSRG